MAIKWSILTLLHCEYILVTLASIAGVTYMDDFDFEDRYRNINECNPLHWHPLHLPEYCATMYEKLIRSNIGFAAYPETSYEISSAEGDYNNEFYEDMLSSYLSTYQSKSLYPKLYRSKTYPQTPYQKMLKLLKKDIKKDPSRPKLGVLPNLGPVAIYDQEISKKSASMIKDLATAYAKYGQERYADYLGYNDSPARQLYVWDSRKNNDTNNIKDQKENNGDRVSRTKTKKGGVVTIVETLRPRRRRQALFWFEYTRGSIDGTFTPTKQNLTGHREECNPLYWYPRHIPEYCYYKNKITQKPPEEFINPPPIPLAIPVPLPPAPIAPLVQIPPAFGPVSPLFQTMFSQSAIQLPYALPFGIPIIPTNPMLPVAGIPLYSSNLSPSSYPLITPSFASDKQNQGIQSRKIIHGLPGIVTPDGGMNILPFTDVISELLEKHKENMILKHLKQVRDEYDHITSKDFNYKSNHDKYYISYIS